LVGIETSNTFINVERIEQMKLTIKIAAVLIVFCAFASSCQKDVLPNPVGCTSHPDAGSNLRTGDDDQNNAGELLGDDTQAQTDSVGIVGGGDDDRDGGGNIVGGGDDDRDGGGKVNGGTKK
jgi:hypothetical protein